MAALLTARLTLDELSLQDAGDLFEVRGDPEAMAHWDWPADESREVTAEVVTEMLRQVSADQARYWTLRSRSDRAFVGLCDLSDMRHGDSADIGFILLRRWWGHGLASEAVAVVLDYARNIGLRTINARVHDLNERSVRLLERAGFVIVGTVPRHEIRPGVFRDCRRFSVEL